MTDNLYRIKPLVFRSEPVYASLEPLERKES